MTTHHTDSKPLAHALSTSSSTFVACAVFTLALLTGCNQFGAECDTDTPCPGDYVCRTGACVPDDSDPLPSDAGREPDPSPSDGGTEPEPDPTDGGGPAPADGGGEPDPSDGGPDDAGNPDGRAPGAICSNDGDCANNDCVELLPATDGVEYDVCRPTPAGAQAECLDGEHMVTWCFDHGCEAACIEKPDDKAGEKEACVVDADCALGACVRTRDGDACISDREVYAFGRPPLFDEVRGFPGCAPPLQTAYQQFDTEEGTRIDPLPICVHACEGDNDCTAFDTTCSMLPDNNFCEPRLCTDGCAAGEDCLTPTDEFGFFPSPFETDVCVSGQDWEVTPLEPGEFGCFPMANDCTNGRCAALHHGDGGDGKPQGVCAPNEDFDPCTDGRGPQEVCTRSPDGFVTCTFGCLDYPAGAVAPYEPCTAHSDCFMGRCFESIYDDGSGPVTESFCTNDVAVGHHTTDAPEPTGQGGCMPGLLPYVVEVPGLEPSLMCLFPCDGGSDLHNEACLPSCTDDSQCSGLNGPSPYRCTYEPPFGNAEAGVCVPDHVAEARCSTDAECGDGVCDLARGRCAPPCDASCDNCLLQTGVGSDVCLPENIPVCTGNEGEFCHRGHAVPPPPGPCDPGQVETLFVNPNLPLGVGRECRWPSDLAWPGNVCGDLEADVAPVVVEWAPSGTIQQATMCAHQESGGEQPFALCTVGNSDCGVGTCEPITAPNFSNLHLRWLLGDDNYFPSYDTMAGGTLFEGALGVCVSPCEAGSFGQGGSAESVCLGGTAVMHPEAGSLPYISGGLLISQMLANTLPYDVAQGAVETPRADNCEGPFYLFDKAEVGQPFQSPVAVCASPTFGHAVRDADGFTVVAPSYLAPLPDGNGPYAAPFDIIAEPAFCSSSNATEAFVSTPSSVGRVKVCLQKSMNPDMYCGTQGEAVAYEDSEFVCPLAGIGLKSGDYIGDGSFNDKFTGALCASGSGFGEAFADGYPIADCSGRFSGDLCETNAQCDEGTRCNFYDNVASGLQSPFCLADGTSVGGCTAAFDCTNQGEYCFFSASTGECRTPCTNGDCNNRPISQGWAGDACANDGEGNTTCQDGLVCLGQVCR